MCSEAQWALRWSMLSHFSMTTKVSAPNLANGPPSVSTVAPYSMQPFSACTAGTLALKFLSISSRLPGLAVMMAITMFMMSSRFRYVGSTPAGQQTAGDLGVGGTVNLSLAAYLLTVCIHGNASAVTP